MFKIWGNINYFGTTRRSPHAPHLWISIINWNRTYIDSDNNHSCWLTAANSELLLYPRHYANSTCVSVSIILFNAHEIPTRSYRIIILECVQVSFILQWVSSTSHNLPSLVTVLYLWEIYLGLYYGNPTHNVLTSLPLCHPFPTFLRAGGVLTIPLAISKTQKTLNEVLPSSSSTQWPSGNFISVLSPVLIPTFPQSQSLLFTLSDVMETNFPLWICQCASHCDCCC